MEKLARRLFMEKRKLTFMEMLKAVGPGAMITAAFVGPGTVATCTTAGASYGYTLLWAVTFSVVATIIFQSMTARVALVGKKDLVQAIAELTDNKTVQFILRAFVLTVVLIACFAFQAGNLIGAAIGMNAVTGLTQETSAVILGVAVLAVVLLGSYKRIEKIMIFFVLVMSVSFLVAAIGVGPNVLAVLKGAFVPVAPEGSFVTVIALIGTTIVPMNLLLHSIIVRERWDSPENMLEAKIDSRISISIGGIITAAIVVTSGTLFFGKDVNTAVMQFHQMLEPVLGSFWARMVGGTGLMVAGFSSAIAVPLTAGYVMARMFGWENQFSNNKFRLVTLIIVLFGTVLAYLNKRPVEIIILAQAINGIFLPFVTCFIMYAMNSKKLLGDAVNKLGSNVLGGLATAVAIFLGVRGFIGAVGRIAGMF